MCAVTWVFLLHFHDCFMQEAENVELKPGVMRACKDERSMFCKGVVPGGARMFR